MRSRRSRIKDHHLEVGLEDAVLGHLGVQY